MIRLRLCHRKRKHARARNRDHHFRSLRLEPLENRLALNAAFPEFVDPNPNPGNQFGHSVVPLSTGNVVITSPYDDAGGPDAGAVYLFNGATGALISTLTGSSADDKIGGFGVTALTNGNYVVLSPTWDNGAATDAGAVTFGSGISGVSGAVSAANSLIGATTSDFVGGEGGVTALPNGNYVVRSSQWDNGTAADAGAVTFGNGTSGAAGVVSAANSLVGSTSNDYVGNRVTVLTNGNYVVRSPDWNNGAATDAGAVTFGSGTSGVVGAVSAANSLVGSTSNDRVGNGGVTALTNGNYVVRSYVWANGTAFGAGAVTFGNGTSGVAGAVSAANSLVGSGRFDEVGRGGVTALTNGNYVVASADWENGAALSAGAVTFGDGTSGVTGAVTATNSLVGSTGGDLVGIGGVTALTNGNYVVASLNWDNGAVSNVGAVTFGSGISGVTGVVSAANSLIGSITNDFVGYGGDVTALPNGNYVVRSSRWNNGAATEAGAVTFGDGTSGVNGVVSAANSLVGSTSNDRVGSHGVTALTNGNYVVRSPSWDNGAATNAGAVTLGSGISGVTGVVAASNSLVGSTSSDQVGSDGVTALTNGNYVVPSPNWDNGTISDAGAVTFGNGTSGVTGVVSAANSLVGSTSSDQVGDAGVTALTDGNYVVRSLLWDNGTVTNAGAVTFGSGASGVAGVVSAVNSLVGSTNGDGIGSGGVTPLTNGNYLVRSQNWDDGATTNAGAVTFGSGTSGVSGAITTSNSLIGEAVNTGLLTVVVDDVNSNFFGRFVKEGEGRVRVGSQFDGLAAPTTFTVNSTGDDADADVRDDVCETATPGECTLRAAIEQANATANVSSHTPDVIAFDIPAIGPIQPESELPPIIEAVVIDGTTQPGFAGTPLIELDGTNAGAGANGLQLTDSIKTGSTIRGLVINNFDSAAIRIASDSGGHMIRGNVLGLDVDGSTVAKNRFGLHVSSADNTIEGNVISGNNRGILFDGGGATGNVVRANLIGTDAGGNASRGNLTDGVKIRGGSGNTIGGPTEADGNVISANFTGVAVFGGSANNNTVQHNLIGTKSTGDGNRGNNVGINLIGAPGTTIKDNVVAGSKRQAIRLIKPDTAGTLIENNLIGLDLTGTLPIATTYDGIQIANAQGNTIRGNVIANSGYNGIRLLNAGATDNVVQGNLIGTALDGTTPMGNALAGILIKNAPGNQIGGTEPGEGNTISANGEHGILIERAGATNNMIEGNRIGTNAAGTAALGNGSHGIQVDDGTGNVIGGTAVCAGNVIGGNLMAGIAVTGGIATIQGNFIGTDAGGTLDLGNANDGVIVNGGAATIGGAAPGAGNVIADNGLNGVKINSGTGNAILGNSIHDNTALGVDLKPNGQTDNDPGDADTGANNLQNSPEIQSIVLNGMNMEITYVVDSTATHADYTGSGLKVEFFIADANGQEGETFLVDDEYSTPQTPEVAVIPAAGVYGQIIVATATDVSGNTSEFSAPFTAPSPLLAAGGEVDGGSARSLIHATLDPIVDAAIDRWAAAGFGADLFGNVQFTIADLPGATLGLATGNTITIDINAAGYGWFVGSSEQRAESGEPGQDAKQVAGFQQPSNSQLRMDLLTVIMHELGHVAGLQDIYDGDDADDLMDAWLTPGTRRTTIEAVDAAFTHLDSD